MKKKAIYLALFSLLSNSIYGQGNWSIGLRTGFTIIKPATYIGLQTIKHNPIMQAQIFGSRQFSKRLEIEVNTTYNTPITTSSLSTYNDDGPQYWFLENTETVLELGINAKYSFIKKDKYSIYALAGLNANKTFYTSKQYNSAYYGWSGYVPERYSNSKSSFNEIPNQILIGCGINKVLSNQWNLNVQSFMPIYIEGLHSMSMGENKTLYPVLQLGLAYCW